ncbi:hypothetical protein D3C71_1440860 [compost metagenome]
MDEGRLSKIRSADPPITSVSAGLLPLYGTCVMRVPVMVWNSSPDRCVDVPLPVEAMLTVLGFAFRYLIRSATVRMPCLSANLGFSSRMFGTGMTSVTGMKSFTGS